MARIGTVHAAGLANSRRLLDDELVSEIREAMECETWPDEDGPRKGSCWNCRHVADLMHKGCYLTLCCANRDRDGEGEVDIVSVPPTACDDWELNPYA